MMEIPLLRVNQWLDSWKAVGKQVEQLGDVPHHFYLASISLLKLRTLAGVHKRDTNVRKVQSKNAGYQRNLDQSRTRQIGRFIRSGFPLSSQLGLDPDKYSDLVHPGWLPTSILVNVLHESDVRRRAGQDCRVPKERLLRIVNRSGNDFLIVPEEAFTLKPSTPNSLDLQPIEIIDGQHRVFSVDNFERFPEDYQVPVVIFNGLSESWQAYLFWVINVEPKRINTSLAFDLYPELRTQSWLERGETIKIYQEHRAQELTEIMWKHGESVWKDMIELLVNRVSGHVSNASFIRSLTSSFVRKWADPEKVGGLFGAIDERDRILPWKRSQQAAFLIFCWKVLSDRLAKVNANWKKSFETEKNPNSTLPIALVSGKSLLSTDQGVRAIHYIVNLLCVKNYQHLNLEEWYMSNIPDIPEEEAVSQALKELGRMEPLCSFLNDTFDSLLTNMDWRTSNASGLSEDEVQKQSAYRGSSGYSLLRRKAIEALSRSANCIISNTANDLIK